MLTIALSDERGKFMLQLNRADDLNISHSTLTQKSICENDSDFKEIDVSTLFDLIESYPLIKSVNSLLKLDVDGFEYQILKGGRSNLAYFDLIIVEMPLRFYRERLGYLQDNNFQLIDIVDPTYYHGHLSQVDMIFASKTFIDKNKSFEPWGYYKFEWADYVHWCE